MRSVHAIKEHGPDLRPFGSAHVRLLRPLGHPSNHDRLLLTHGIDYQPADVVIVQRFWKPSGSMASAEELVRTVRREGGKLLYEIDDNLLDLNEVRTGPGANPVPIEALMTVRFLARESDGILVSTQALKARMAGLNSNIVVVPNALDERLFPDPGLPPPARSRRRRRRTVIGYMGTLTHDADVMMVLQALRRVLRAHRGQVEMQFIGAVADRGTAQLFAGLPVRFLEVGANDDYPDFVRWMREHARWDLAIAPLEDSAFARCKSDIKFLDYSALGIPGVYSRVPSYASSVQDGQTGLLVNNNVDEWTDALRSLIADESLRRHLAERARQYVFTERVLRHRALDWADAIERMCAAVKPSGGPGHKRISKVSHGHRRTLRTRARAGAGSVRRAG